MLVVLAASPVTAPFSTCDLAVLFARSRDAAQHATNQLSPTISVATRIADGVDSVSPLVSRTDAPDVSSSPAIVLPDSLVTGERPESSFQHFLAFSHSPHDRFARPTVLRL